MSPDPSQAYLYFSISTVTFLDQRIFPSYWGSTWSLCFALVLLQFLLYAFPTFKALQFIVASALDVPYLLLPVGSF